MAWTDFVNGFKELGIAGGEVYQAWDGSSTEEEVYEKAYLSGQLAALNQQQQREQSADVVKIGDVELSTSSILWIVGGTLGLLTIGLAFKKML